MSFWRSRLGISRCISKIALAFARRRNRTHNNKSPQNKPTAHSNSRCLAQITTRQVSVQGLGTTSAVQFAASVQLAQPDKQTHSQFKSRVTKIAGLVRDDLSVALMQKTLHQPAHLPDSSSIRSRAQLRTITSRANTNTPRPHRAKLTRSLSNFSWCSLHLAPASVEIKRNQQRYITIRRSTGGVR